MLGALGRPSLARRLVLLAVGWSLAALVIAALVLALLFQQAALRRFEQNLGLLVDNLIAGSSVQDGEVLAPPFTDQRALRAYSGLYWIIAQPRPDGRLPGAPPSRSRSLWDSELSLPADLLARLKGQTHPTDPIAFDTYLVAPEGGVGGLQPQPGDRLRAVAKFTIIEGQEAVFVAAETRGPIDRDVRNFAFATAAAFLLLGGLLIVAVVVQVRVGLQPLFRLRREVAEVRGGKSERLKGDYPSELAPLTDELNALVRHNQETVERQRTHVGNLAHALKTPISVILTESAQRPGPLAEVVARQAEVMRQQVDHHLRRARAAARAQTPGERTLLAEVLDEMARTLERIFRDKGLVIDWDAPDDLAFLGERQDLLEIAGNGMENAGKWCRSKFRVRGEPLGEDRMRLIIEDDGPGLPEELRDAVVRRGARLDESSPGSGLGLSIIDELARAYRGSLTLDSSPLGGLRLVVDLPRAEV